MLLIVILVRSADNHGAPKESRPCGDEGYIYDFFTWVQDGGGATMERAVERSPKSARGKSRTPFFENIYECLLKKEVYHNFLCWKHTNITRGKVYITSLCAFHS